MMLSFLFSKKKGLENVFKLERQTAEAGRNI